MSEQESRGFQVGDQVRVVLNAEVIGLSTDREWLLLSPGRIWVPIDEFVEPIMPQPENKQPTIVCLCGSTRFSEAFHEANLSETLAGRIVLTIGCDFKSDRDLLLAGDLTQEDKERLDELHLRKIDLASEILVLNVNGYIGQSTRREIEYAEAHGKRVRYIEHKMSS